MVKQEMALLNEADQPDSVIEEYLAQLDQLLREKLVMAMELREKLLHFRGRRSKHGLANAR